jgi:catechol 2,3-dioxygenase-like lactoylglutathione lyase family enzyme
MGVARLDHVVLAVTDYERSNRFYADVLGVEVVGISRGRYAYKLPGDQQLNVHGPGASPVPRAVHPVRPGNSDLCFVWDGTPQEAIEHLHARGIEIELGPAERTGGAGRGVSVYFRDPDGTLLELISYS